MANVIETFVTVNLKIDGYKENESLNYTYIPMHERIKESYWVITQGRF